MDISLGVCWAVGIIDWILVWVSNALIEYLAFALVNASMCLCTMIAWGWLELLGGNVEKRIIIDQ